MANADTAATASDRLLELVGCLEREAGFAEVVESLQGGHAATLDGVWGSSCALVAAALAAHAPATLVVVCPQIDQVDELIDDLALFTRLTPERFPASESLPTTGGPRRGLRRAAARAEAACKAPTPPKLVVTSIQSLLQPVPSRETLGRQTRTLRVGDAVAVGELGQVAGRERFRQHAGRGIARRVLGPRRHHRHLRPRLGRPGARRVLRRRDRIDPAVRDFQPAEPGIARSGRRDDRRAGGGATGPIWPTICRRKAGSC